MAPPPRGCMTARADWQQWNVPMRFTAMMRSHSSGVLSTNGLMTSMPALFTRIDKRPDLGFGRRDGGVDAGAVA